MRWRSQLATPKPKPGDKRVRTKFAWTPTTMQFGVGHGMTAWLEWYKVEEEFVRELGYVHPNGDQYVPTVESWQILRSDILEFWDLPPGSCPL